MALQFTDVNDRESIIEVYGSIGEGWESSDKKKTATCVSGELARIKALKADTITVKINSLGGDVNHALAIHDLLEEHPAQITTQIIGLCASAATIIAAAGTTRKMSRNALFLIHQCSSYLGRANQTQLAAELESQQLVNKRILSIYTANCSNTEEVESLFIANAGQGKWIEAGEALRLGFVTDIYNDTKKAACIDKKAFESSCLPALPAEYTDFLAEEAQNQLQEPEKDSSFQGFFDSLKSLFSNKNNNQNQQLMKNIFPLLCLAASLSDESGYNREKGATFSDEQLQAIEKSLKEFADLKAAFQTLQAEKETVKQQYASLKTIIDKLPGSTPGVTGSDPQPNSPETFADWQKTNKYYQEITDTL